MASATLTDLPNIGEVLARKLESVGISDEETLRRVGAVAAALRMGHDGDAACRSRLSAMEGAIRGVRWHAIPAEERAALWREYQARRNA